MLSSREAPQWHQPIVPSEVVDIPAPSTSLEEAVRLALARRPELGALAATRAQNEVDRQFYSDQTKPQLDLVGTYTLSGLAGSALQSSTPIDNGSSDAALLARLNDLSERRPGAAARADAERVGGSAVSRRQLRIVAR
jgi:hypothetical protein